MAAGDAAPGVAHGPRSVHPNGGYDDRQLHRVEQATRQATADSGLAFSVFLGDVHGAPRETAQRMHEALGDRASAGVLVLVAPGQRRLEIVTGPIARHRISDRACALAALSMTTTFAGGDLLGGIVTGLRMLAESAGAAPKE